MAKTTLLPRVESWGIRDCDLLWLAALLFGAPLPAAARDQVDFDIPQRAMRTAQFARQAGRSVLIPTERSVSSPRALRGKYSVEEALSMLLDNSGVW
jgi:hypothetical protein